MKKLLVLLVSLVVFLTSVPLANAWLFTDTSCKTKYPIVLVHGAFWRDKNLLGIQYWWNIPSALRAKGATVYVTNQDPFNSEAVRAQQVANELGVQFALHPTWTKVNLIGHSMGPLDSRNVISNLSIPGVCAAGTCNTKIASLTSISGTHTGSEVADFLAWAWWDIPLLKYTFIPELIGDTIAGLIGLFGGMLELAPEQNVKALEIDLLSPTVQNVFNPNTPNRAGVYYQAYGGKINYINLAADPLGQGVSAICYAVMKVMGVGDNDSLVSTKSAHIPTLCKAGETCTAPVYKGDITTSILYPGVNHFYEIQQFFGITPGFDGAGFYVNIAKGLKAKGL
jgi:triacylglycerol lipase